MPDDAAVWRKERREREVWTQQDELLAGLIESNGAYLHVICQLLWKGHQFKGEPKLGNPPRIEHERRPSAPVQDRVTKDAAAIRRFFSNN